jgi:hypothetical protein
VKVIYTESDITKSAATLLICPFSLDKLYATTLERRFRRAFPDTTKVAEVMLTPSKLVEKDMMPALGDVIWTEAGGNQMFQECPAHRTIGYCLVRETREDDININALQAVMESVTRKAKELGEVVVGMDLFGCEDSRDWAGIVSTIENTLQVQAVVCVPNNALLCRVVDSLPGSGEIKVFHAPRD